jgi:DNA-directed RNA polymerase beta' subunit
MTTNIKNQTIPPLGHVKYIQTFLPDSNYIRKRSALDIKNPDEVLDTRLGVMEWDKACATCDNFLENCPGHPGSIELPIPVFRIFFVRKLIQILNCICFHCGNLRLPKNDPEYEHIYHLKDIHRLSVLLAACKNYKICGEQYEQLIENERIIENNYEIYTPTVNHNNSTNTNSISYNKTTIVDSNSCGKHHVNFVNEDKDYTFIRGIVTLTVDDFKLYEKDHSWKPLTLGPFQILECLSSLSNEVLHMLGCNEYNHPKNMMWEVIPVPSMNTRPSHSYSGLGGKKKSAFNDWTKQLQNIVKSRNYLQNMLNEYCDPIKISGCSTLLNRVQTYQKYKNLITCCHYIFNKIESNDFRECFKYGFNNKTSKTMIKDMKMSARKSSGDPIEMAWRDLHTSIAAFHSDKHKKYNPHCKSVGYGKPLSSVEDRFKRQKEGRIRGYIVARRINNAGRGVLESSLAQKPDEVLFPIREAMKLSKIVYINKYNVKKCAQWILNGPYKHPGCNYVTLKNGKEINLMFYSNRRDIDISQVLFIRRHLIDGDIVLVGRQPTLHRGSMQAFKLKVTNELVIRWHPSVFLLFGADTDGDEVNLYVLMKDDAIAEAYELASVKNNIMKDGKVWVNFILNAVISAYIMSRHVFLTKEQVSNITQDFDIWELPAPCLRKPHMLWTGHQIISLLFPPDFTLITKTNPLNIKEPGVFIQNGQYLCGYIDSNVLNGHNGFIHNMYLEYKDQCIDFIHKGYLLFQRFLDIFGLSAGYYDCSIHFDHDQVNDKNIHDENLLSIIHQMNHVKTLIQKANDYSDQFVDHNPMFETQVAIETNLKEHIDKINTASMNAVYDYHTYIDKKSNSNGILHMINSGAKGSKNTLNQMCGIVGQIFVLYKRFPFPTSHFKRGHNTLSSFGFAVESYSKGISLTTLANESHGTCESVINKNKGTAKPGHCVRRMTICMMGVVVDHYKRVVDNSGRILWNLYGNDGHDPQILSKCKLRLFAFSFDEIIKKYGIIFDSNILQNEFKDKLKNVPSCYVQMNNIENFLNKETLKEWRVMKNDAHIHQELHKELFDLMSFKKDLHVLLSRCGEVQDFSTVKSPIPFKNVFEKCASLFMKRPDKVDMTPIQYRFTACKLWDTFVSDQLVSNNNLILKAIFFDWFSTKSLICTWKFSMIQIQWLIYRVRNILVQARIHPGESVGVHATQCLGEPFTQLSLKMPHVSGRFSSTVAGTTRMSNLIENNYSNPTMTIVLEKNIKNQIDAEIFALSIVKCYIKDIASRYPTYTCERKRHANGNTKERILFNIYLDRKKTVSRMISLRNMVIRIGCEVGIPFNCFTVPKMNENDDEWIVSLHITTDSPFWKSFCNIIEEPVRSNYLPNSCNLDLICENIIQNLYYNLIINGIAEIENFICEEVDIRTFNGKTKRWVITTLGSNLCNILRRPEVDGSRTTSNDVKEMCSVFGVHAARKALEREFLMVMSNMSDTRHVQLISRKMTSDLVIKGMKIRDVSNQLPPLQKGVYEQCPKQMVEYCGNGATDNFSTICGAALANERFSVGTGYNMKIIKQHNYPFEIKQTPEKPLFNMCSYVFSPKVDGVRYFLAFFKTIKKHPICALVNRNFDICKLRNIDYDNLLSNWKIGQKLFEGTILDGELTLLNDGSYAFIIFDCLMSSGNRTSILRYDQRIEIANEIVYRLQLCPFNNNNNNNREKYQYEVGEKISIPNSFSRSKTTTLSTFSKIPFLPFLLFVKPIFDIHRITEYHTTYERQLPFKTDGYVFTHISLPAYPFRMKKEGIFKWKFSNSEFDENTIDMIVYPIEQYRYQQNIISDLSNILTPESHTYRIIKKYQSTKGNYILVCPLNIKQQTSFNFSLGISSINIQSGQCYECRWSHKQQTWEIVRFRKKTPNTWSTIIATVKSIYDPIQIQDISNSVSN